MNRDEFFELDAAAAAEKLNALLAEGKTPEELLAEVGISKNDLMKAQIFFVKDKYMARGWGGYTSTKRATRPATTRRASAAAIRRRALSACNPLPHCR